MLNVYLLRHGQTQWNFDGNRYCGRTDIRLTEIGLVQAQMAGEQLKGIFFEGIYCSPLQRAYETAKIASDSQNISKDDRLIEADFGQWEGKTKEEFIAEDPALWNNWVNDPSISRAGGTSETASDIIKRVNHFFHELLLKHKEGNILVVAHNGINRLYLAYKLGMQLKDYRKLVQDNSTITIFQLDKNEEFTLVHLNSKL